ncbi:TetR/AcrR family transcriptional regulator [Kitasatospora sp. LaBMicrA B282]|uniref:TetR/AcrR family transcriptional regulator n=1 Tax=Kitasatospora sp. LaBMicrA B282 TaxID=3420949 RepID=UPI003D106D34
MNEAGPGRREENKRRTHDALVEAAARLFRERGYESTTVRDIAQEAGVGERTFFRYFPSKENLIMQQVREIIPPLAEELRARPVGEPPLTALCEAVLEIAFRYDSPITILLVGPQPMSPDPHTRGEKALLFDLESMVAGVFLERFAAAGAVGGEPAVVATGVPRDEQLVLRADVLARSGIAVLRAVRLTYHQLSERRRGEIDMVDFVRRAFAELGVPYEGPAA